MPALASDAQRPPRLPRTAGGVLLVKAPVPVRLLLEAVLLLLGSLALAATGRTPFATVMLLHYALLYDRVLWLLRD